MRLSPCQSTFEREHKHRKQIFQFDILCNLGTEWANKVPHLLLVLMNRILKAGSHYTANLLRPAIDSCVSAGR